MAYTTTELYAALELVKTRLNRTASDTSMDEYLSLRLESSYTELSAIQGIEVDASKTNELMFWVDFTAWQYQGRDKTGGMPEWLRRQRMELYLTKHSDSWKEANP